MAECNSILSFLLFESKVALKILLLQKIKTEEANLNIANGSHVIKDKSENGESLEVNFKYPFQSIALFIVASVELSVLLHLVCVSFQLTTVPVIGAGYILNWRTIASIIGQRYHISYLKRIHTKPT